MVLGNANNTMASGSENIPPSPATGRKTQHSLVNSAARRRERVQGGMRKTASKIQQAKRRADKEKEKDRKHAEPLQFKVPALPRVADVEMADAEPETASSSGASSAPTGQRPFMFNVPQYLSRPAPKEVDHKFLEKQAPMSENLSPSFLRDVLAAEGHEMLRSVSTVRPTLNSQALPREMTVTIAPNTTHLPSHMLAVFHRYTAPAATAANGQPQARPRKVTLYPVHSLVLAANCATITTPPPPNAVPQAVLDRESDQLAIPVWPLALPHPPSYNQLSSYLYTKDAEFLMRTALPIPPPAGFLDAQDGDAEKKVLGFANTLAQTFTSVALAKTVVNLHGLWANAFALEVVDEMFFDVMDVMWKTLMTAMAISTGQPLPRYDAPSPRVASVRS